MEIVEVEWLDAGTCAHEMTMEEAQEHGLVESRTVGYLTKHNKEGITLIMTLFTDVESTKFKWTIPRGMIKKIKRLGKV